MDQFEFDSEARNEIRDESRSFGRTTKRNNMKEEKASAAATEFMSFFVRLVGLLMLLLGLWVGVKVIVEVWALYKGPHHIERFADAIDRGSNLDKVLASFSSKKTKKTEDGKQVSTRSRSSGETVRISYFLAWIIVILLLMLIGRLAMMAIKTGGELALYDLQVKRFARLLMEDIRQQNRDRR